MTHLATWGSGAIAVALVVHGSVVCIAWAPTAADEDGIGGGMAPVVGVLFPLGVAVVAPRTKPCPATWVNGATRLSGP